jgi:hypothetical protein
VRGPNSLGPVSKRGLDRPGPAFVAASLRPDDAQEDGFVGTRVVGKVDDLTFGTGLRRAKYWVQRDYVAGNATSHGEGDGWAKELQVDEHCVAVYNLPPGANETWIRALFSRCGTVKQVFAYCLLNLQSCVTPHPIFTLHPCTLPRALHPASGILHRHPEIRDLNPGVD